MVPNLARRPFRNRRPATRLGWALWLLAVALLGVNGWRYVTYWRGAATTRAEIARLDGELVAERERSRAREQVLAGMQLEEGNRQARFLNAKIAERTFSWSGLLDDLEEVLPRGVRIDDLGPKRSEARGRSEADGAVHLSIRGAAEDEQALLDLIDNLFAHQAFARPDLRRENLEDLRQWGFDLSVTYWPRRSQHQPATAVASADHEATGAVTAGGEGTSPREVAGEPATASGAVVPAASGGGRAGASAAPAGVSVGTQAAAAVAERPPARSAWGEPVPAAAAEAGAASTTERGGARAAPQPSAGSLVAGGFIPAPGVTAPPEPGAVRSPTVAPTPTLTPRSPSTPAPQPQDPVRVPAGPAPADLGPAASGSVRLVPRGGGG